MTILLNIVLLLHVVAAIAIIILVLLQHGKGADMGAAFGGGSAGSLFGATGSASFLSRLTAGFATVFFITSLAMAYIATHKPKASGAGVMDSVTSVPSKAPGAPQAPAAPSPAAIPGAPSSSTIPGAGGATPAAPAEAPKSTQVPK